MHEEPVELGAPTEEQEIVPAYHSTGLTLRRHPLALLRDRLRAMNLSAVEELDMIPDRKLARTTGIVTIRQRPGTAGGVMFLWRSTIVVHHGWQQEVDNSSTWYVRRPTELRGNDAISTLASIGVLLARYNKQHNFS